MFGEKWIRKVEKVESLQSLKKHLEKNKQKNHFLSFISLVWVKIELAQNEPLSYISACISHEHTKFGDDLSILTEEDAW